jgi:hypothetical protein
MLLAVNIMILVALIKLAIQTDKPMMCAGIYVGAKSLFALGLGREFTNVLIAAIIGFILAAIYFWLLVRTQESALFWVIAIVGIVIGFV